MRHLSTLVLSRVTFRVLVSNYLFFGQYSASLEYLGSALSRYGGHYTDAGAKIAQRRAL